MALLSLADLRAIEPNIEEHKAQALIEDVLSYAKVKVPGLSGTLTLDQEQAVRGILREQVLRRYAAGAGDVQQQTAGPFSMTFRNVPIVSNYALGRLRDVLGLSSSQAFEIDTLPAEAAAWPVAETTIFEAGW